jgi:regulatory protein
MNAFDKRTFKKNVRHASNRALKYLSRRPMSVKEMTAYLKNKKYAPQVISRAIEWLIQKRFLNDTEFARMYVDNKKRFNPRSRFALRYELSGKGISSEKIDLALIDVDDYKFALLAVKSKLKLWKNFEENKLKKKLMNYLKNRGFNYEISITAFHHIMESKYDN